MTKSDKFEYLDTPPTSEAQLWFNWKLNLFYKLTVDFILSSTWKNNLWWDINIYILEDAIVQI